MFDAGGDRQGNDSLPSRLVAAAPVTGGRQAGRPRRVMSARTAKAMASRASGRHAELVGPPHQDRRDHRRDPLHQGRVLQPASRRDDLLRRADRAGHIAEARRDRPRDELGQGRHQVGVEAAVMRGDPRDECVAVHLEPRSLRRSSREEGVVLQQLGEE